jgi:HEPN domain-containing protein
MSADSTDLTEWITYASENLQIAQLALEGGLLNPCLQNVQQTIEKALKAMRIRHGLGLKRTHSIHELNRDLLKVQIDLGLSGEDCELLDSIYVGSKYPGQSVLPKSPPDAALCRKYVDLANKILADVEKRIAVP